MRWRGDHIRRAYPDNVCNQESCPTPESRWYRVNSSRDMNVQLVNVNGTEPNHQEEKRDA